MSKKITEEENKRRCRHNTFVHKSAKIGWWGGRRWGCICHYAPNPWHIFNCIMTTSTFILLFSCFLYALMSYGVLLTKHPYANYSAAVPAPYLDQGRSKAGCHPPPPGRCSSQTTRPAARL
jgi:hypothetical protein